MAGMTLEEFIRAYKKESPFELVDSEIRPLSLMVAGHATVLKNIYDPLSQYVNAHGLGEVFYRLPYLITDAEGIVTNSRTPDLMFISKKRFEKYKAEYTDWEEKPILILPDLAVKIIFYDDTDAVDSIGRIWRDNVLMVWGINVPKRIIQKWRPGNYEHYLMESEKLTGGTIIPDFSIPVSNIFQNLVSEVDDLRQKLVRQIQEAFAETPYPGDENITVYEYEIDEAAFRGKHWKDIPLQTIFQERNELPFFTPEAYRFYLPAFMIGSLLHYIEMDTLSSNLISGLSPYEKEIDYFLRKCGGFSPNEQKSVLAFLESFLKFYPEEYLSSSVYRPILDSGIEYWKGRLKAKEE